MCLQYLIVDSFCRSVWNGNIVLLQNTQELYLIVPESGVQFTPRYNIDRSLGNVKYKHLVKAIMYYRLRGNLRSNVISHSAKFKLWNPKLLLFIYLFVFSLYVCLCCLRFVYSLFIIFRLSLNWTRFVVKANLKSSVNSASSNNFVFSLCLSSLFLSPLPLLMFIIHSVFTYCFRFISLRLSVLSMVTVDKGK